MLYVHFFTRRMNHGFIPGFQACADVDSSNDNGSIPSGRWAANGATWAFSEDGNENQMKFLKMCKKLKFSSLPFTWFHCCGGQFFGGDAQASFQGPAQAICIGQP